MEKNNKTKKIFNICKVSENAIIPNRATSGSAGMDLHACMDKEITLNPGERTLIKCGIAISLPSNEYVALLFARSGLAIKHGISLSNSVGVIDSDYRGEICVALCNLGNEPYTIKPNERIAQLVIMKVETPEFNEVQTLDSTERGVGGFGSTGK